MAIGAGVAVDRRAHRPGNARQRFQTLQPASGGEVHQILQHRARVHAMTHSPAAEMERAMKRSTMPR